MKGQLTIQYLASFIFFIGLIVYIYFAYSANLPAFVEEVRKEDVRSKAFQLSEILINDPGHPVDWWDDNKYPTLNDIKRVGLSDESLNKTNFILLDKVKKLDKSEPLCSDFKNIQQKLAFDKPFSIHIFNISLQNPGERKLLIDCIPLDFSKTTINATIKRIVALNNTETGKLELAEVIIQM